MSKENVEIVRRSLDAYAQRDTDGLRAVSHPDVQLDWSASRSWLAGTYRGFEECLRFYEGYFEAFEAISIKAECFLHAEELVIVPNTARQRGRDGIEVSARSTIAFTVVDRRITRICLYQDTNDALAALGLSGDSLARRQPLT
jgi:ketosteroid isomerase-like protein